MFVLGLRRRYVIQTILGNVLRHNQDTSIDQRWVDTNLHCREDRTPFRCPVDRCHCCNSHSWFDLLLFGKNKNNRSSGNRSSNGSNGLQSSNSILISSSLEQKGESNLHEHALAKSSKEDLMQASLFNFFSNSILFLCLLKLRL